MTLEIKQFGTCSVRLSFRKRSQVCKFFVVEHETAIIGITDSEKLGLVSVNFDMVQNEKHVKIIAEVNEETFKQTIEKEYPDLFKGIGLMDERNFHQIERWCGAPCRAHQTCSSCDAGTTEKRTR